MTKRDTPSTMITIENAFNFKLINSDKNASSSDRREPGTTSCLEIINLPNNKNSLWNRNSDSMTKLSKPNHLDLLAEWEPMNNREEKLIY